MTISGVSAARSATQEAMETVAQTKAEAAKGDSQAVRKLAAAQSNQAQAPQSTAPKGTGLKVDTQA